jgi:hypothetical protein
VASIELDIEGVPDRAIERAIRQRVGALGQHVERSSDWQVRLGPSAARGEWDLGVRRKSGWHVAWFTAPVDRLPDIIERMLRERLELNS